MNESYEVASYDVAKDDEKENKRDIYRDEIPMALCMLNTVGKQKAPKSYVVLFDSGSTSTWWNMKSLPPGAVPRKVDSSSSTTLNGNMASNLEIDLEDIAFPEFFRSRRIGLAKARVFLLSVAMTLSLDVTLCTRLE